MKRIVSCLFIIVAFLLPIGVKAANDSEKLGASVDDILQFVQQNRLDQADKMLRQLSGDFSSNSFIEDMKETKKKVLSTVFKQAVYAVEDDTKIKQEVYEQVLRLRLAIDATTAHYNPMWLGRKGQVLSSFSSMEEALTKGDNKAFQKAYNTFASQIDIIYPSLVLDLKETHLDKLHTNLTYVETNRHHMMNNAFAHAQFNILKERLYEIFDEPHKDESIFSMMWLSIIIGGTILFALLYASLRQYRTVRKKGVF
jgi:sporulation protein YpjB